MKRLKSFKIGPFIYSVLRDRDWDGVGNYFGTATHSRQEILLSEDLALGCEIETLLHELMHCVDHVFNGGRVKEDHIRGLSLGLAALMKDNKKEFRILLDLL